MKQQNVHPHTHIFSDFDAHERSLAKRLYTFMEKTWLLEPALEALENIATCRNKASQMIELIA